VFFELVKQGVIRIPDVNHLDVVYEAPVLEGSNFKSNIPDTAKSEPSAQVHVDLPSNAVMSEASFVHLHVHTQYSVLQCTSDISGLIKKAKEWSAPAAVMTDHGNMMAAFQFVTAALKQEVKPIVGCEVNVCRDLHR
jgi:DNA polymerase-3 subunit alpha